MASYKGPLDYIDVATRIIEFREKYPTGSLQSYKDPYVIEVRINENTFKSFMVYSAAAYRHPEDKLPGIGWAYEPIPGPTNFTRDSELQNAETAAWGRAMVAALAVDTKKGIASSEEVRNRQVITNDAPKSAPASKAPKPKREYETVDIAFATALMVSAKAIENSDELKAIYEDNKDLLDCPVDGMTLRDHILQRKAELDAK